MKYKIRITDSDGSSQEFESDSFCIINKDGLGWTPNGNMADFVRAWVEAAMVGPDLGDTPNLENDVKPESRRKPTRADLEFLKEKLKNKRG
jgi:hypothetical protein